MSAPLLVFDGDCSICRRSVDVLVRAGLVAERDTIAFDALPPEHVDAVWEAGIHNEMAAVDTESGEVRSGVRALAWAFEHGARPWLGKLLDSPLLRIVAPPVYRTISYNRRVLAPVRASGGIKCACDPDFRFVYRATFLAALTLLIMALAWLVGRGCNLRTADGSALVVGAREFALVAGCGWGLLLALAAAQLGLQRWMNYAGHLGMTMVVGLVVLLPGALASTLLDGAPLLVVQGAVLLGALYVSLLSQRRRLAQQELRGGWLVAWALCVLCGPVVGLSLFGR